MRPSGPPAPPAVRPPDPAEVEIVPWVNPNQQGTARAHRAAQARKTSGRRRSIDPTTCERDYTAAELEFLGAIQEYKWHSGRSFPSWAEVLGVLHALGYTKAPAAEE
jgi:hypothetical protein